MSLVISEKNRNHSPGRVPWLWRECFGLLKTLGIFAVIAFMLKASVVEAYRIPSGSMEPTLQKGDHILVNKLSYGIQLPFKTEAVLDFRAPRRGDVVVFTLPDDPITPDVDEAETNIIKRVVGLPGDVVQVRGTRLFVNGKPLHQDEEYARWVFGGQKDFGPVTVPEHSVLLLGDNRDQSKDSRYWSDPFLEMSRLKGRAFMIYWNWPAPLERIFHLIH